MEYVDDTINGRKVDQAQASAQVYGSHRARERTHAIAQVQDLLPEEMTGLLRLYRYSKR